MSDKPQVRFIAVEVKTPGFWGASPEGPHHAIAFACDEGADRQGLFRVYEAYDGCYISEMTGGLVYLTEHGEPKIEGYYDAAGTWLGDDLADLAKEARKGAYQPEHNALGWEAYLNLRDYKG